MSRQMRDLTPASIRVRLMAVLAAAATELDAKQIAELAGVSIKAMRGALSTALAKNLIHVSKTYMCRGGRRFFYRMGQKPPDQHVKVDPMETLEALRNASRHHGSLFR